MEDHDARRTFSRLSVTYAQDPAQIAMLLLLGARLPRGGKATIAERIESGHAFLVQITGQDLGFHPQRWHVYLAQTNEGGYRWTNQHLRMPKQIQEALLDPEWCATIELIQDQAQVHRRLLPECLNAECLNAESACLK